MKALKRQQRTFESIGYVQYRPHEEHGQTPEEQRLPAIISYVNGKLAYLRVGTDLTQPKRCTEYALYDPEDQQRLADSDIIEIHFEIPTHIDVDPWRKSRGKL